MTDSEIEFILRHELAHYKRGDNWYKLAVQLFTYLLWWNPAAYLMRRSVNQWMELRSDDLACRFMDDTDKNAYSLLLLRIISFSNTKPTQMITSGFVESFDTTYLKQRVKLLSEKSPRKAPLLSGLIACLCIMLFLGSYSVIVQPAYAPPEIEGDSSFTSITPENAFLVPIGNDQYEVWVDDTLYVILPASAISIPPFDQLPVHEKEN